MGKDKDYDFLLRLVPEGEGSAVSMKVLAAKLGLDCRELRKTVMAARTAGYLVASSDRGYFQPTTVEELRRYYNARRKAAISTFTALRAVRRRLKELEDADGSEN